MALSPTAKRAMFSQETEEAILALLTITHPSTPEVFRLTNDPTEKASLDPLIYGTHSRGQWFYFIPFQLVLPEASDETPPSAKLVVSNIDRELITLVRSFHTPASITIELVLGSSLDAVEVSLSELQILSCAYDVREITLSLGAPLLTTEPYPWASFTPAYFMGLFRSIALTVSTLTALAGILGRLT